MCMSFVTLLQVLPPLKTLKEAGEAELAQGLTRMGGMRLVASKMGMDVDRGRWGGQEERPWDTAYGIRGTGYGLVPVPVPVP